MFLSDESNFKTILFSIKQNMGWLVWLSTLLSKNIFTIDISRGGIVKLCVFIFRVFGP